MTKRVVMKFGGTSVGTIERIQAVALRVVEHKQRTGEQVVVVVSAMSGETDRLIGLYRQVAEKCFEENSREYNQVVASGEQVSSALTAVAIQQLGVRSTALLAHQVQIRTVNRYGLSLIDDVDTERLEQLLSQDEIPVVAGFQGVGQNGDYTTLGRGGSDTTAVAIAAALKPCRCMILTDIDGVYTALPKICKKARKLDQLTFEEMLEMASAGAKVLQSRSVSLAKKYRVPLYVGLSFEDSAGTEIVEEYEGMEDAVVSGITSRIDETMITVRDIPDRPGIAAKVFVAVANAGVVVDMIVQSGSGGNKSTISFTVPRPDESKTIGIIQNLINKEIPGAIIDVNSEIAKLSVVGEGMRVHAGVAAKVFEILAKEGINIELITTSEIKISVAIHENYAELAVRALHSHFLEG